MNLSGALKWDSPTRCQTQFVNESITEMLLYEKKKKKQQTLSIHGQDVECVAVLHRLNDTALFLQS